MTVFELSLWEKYSRGLTSFGQFIYMFQSYYIKNTCSNILFLIWHQCIGIGSSESSVPASDSDSACVANQSQQELQILSLCAFSPSLLTLTICTLYLLYFFLSKKIQFNELGSFGFMFLS